MFLLIPVFKYLKSMVANLKIPRTVFFLFLFTYLKKAYFQILKYLGQYFYLHSFHIFKKKILTNLKKLRTAFLLILFCNISKEHNDESQNI